MILEYSIDTWLEIYAAHAASERKRTKKDFRGLWF